MEIHNETQLNPVLKTPELRKPYRKYFRDCTELQVTAKKQDLVTYLMPGSHEPSKASAKCAV